MKEKKNYAKIVKEIMSKSYIKKIKLETIETWIGKNLKRNVIVIGADTAVYHTAFAVIRTTDTYLILEEIQKIEVPKLSKKSTIKHVLDNVDLFTEQLDNLKNLFAQKYKFDYTQIENCFYSFSVKTTKLLAYNGILTYDRLKRISNNATLIMPQSARSIVGFKKSKNAKGSQLKQEVVDYINNILDLKLKLKDNDQADSIMLALSGIIENEN